MSMIKSKLRLNAAPIPSGVRSSTSIISLLACAAVLLGSNMPAGPDRATLIAITALITLSIATAMLRPIDGLAKLVGHRIALGRSSRERPVPAGSRGRRIAPAAGTSGQRSNSRL